MISKEGGQQRVIVTGGSSGIGAKIVERFCERGHDVLFTFFSNEDGARLLERRYENATAVYCDQGDFSSICSLHQQVFDWLQEYPLNVLVNNAALGSETVLHYQNTSPLITGVSTSGSHLEKLKTSAILDEVLLRVNSLGPLWITEAMLPLFSAESQRSVVMMVGSVGGSSSSVFPEYRPSDLMSKAAVGYLTRHLAAAHAHDHIDVMCVSPGATETDMFRASTLSKVSDVKAFLSRMPKGALIQPEEIAESIVWLCTKSCGRIFHGAVLDASMGLGVRPGLQTEQHAT